MKWVKLYEPFRRKNRIITPQPYKEPMYWTCLEYANENEANEQLQIALKHYHNGRWTSWQQNDNVSQWARLE